MTTRMNQRLSSEAATRGVPTPRESERVARGDVGSGEIGSLPVRDETFALVSTLYHALQGAETMNRYVEDARRGGHGELVSFFEDCQRLDRERALRARRLLALQLKREDELGSDTVTGTEEDDDDDDEAI